MLKLYEYSSRKKITKKTILFLKKRYKIYFWLLKSPTIKNCTNKNLNETFRFFHLKKRLDVILYQIGFTKSIKQSRFIITKLKIFMVNNQRCTKNQLLRKNSIFTLKDFFFKTFLTIFTESMKSTNLELKKSAWVLKNSYKNNKSFSKTKILSLPYYTPKFKIKKYYYNKDILFDSKNFNFIVF